MGDPISVLGIAGSPRRQGNTDCWGEPMCGNLDAMGEIENHPQVLPEALDLGRRAVEEP